MESLEVLPQHDSVPFPHVYRNSQPFQILIESLSTEVDLTRHEEVPHVSLKFRCGKTDDLAAHAAQPATTPLETWKKMYRTSYQGCVT